MQITLVSSGDTVSDVLNRFEANFSSIFNWVVTEKESGRSLIAISEVLAKTRYICDLKRMADFLATAFNVADLDAPKRNSKVSLAGWIAQVLLSIREVMEASGAITEQVTAAECPDCGFVHEPFQNTLCPDGSVNPEIIDPADPGVEVLEPEEKPIYTISILADGAFCEERVSRLPPFLIDRKGNLLKKFWHRSCDVGYSEITSKHLSNIAIDSGLVVKLMADNLEVSQACIVGDPPPFIVDRGGVYKRDQVRRGLAVSYSQVISEYLSNIVLIG